MPPVYVKPYVKRHKNDAVAICEAVTRANMRFGAPEQQSSGSTASRFFLMRGNRECANVY